MNVLYLTYDGLTDPVGQSQILKYLVPLAELGYSFHIISFEKPAKFKLLGQEVQVELDRFNITWTPLNFTSSPPILSKIWDRVKFKAEAQKYCLKHSPDIVHCRSYAAAEVGEFLKQKFQSKFLFDMRGFWADEKADAGTWNRSNWFWERVYKFYKSKEKSFVVNSDHIVSLTKAGEDEMRTWSFYSDVPISVIPCCANMEHFSLTDETKKQTARDLVKIPQDAFVVSYLGSIGAWYMFEEMLDFYSALKAKNKESWFLIVSNAKYDFVWDKIKNHMSDYSKIVVLNSSYSDVPKYMYASDVSLSFVKPVYSKISSSPIKNGEILSMGIPLVMSDIGDASLLSNEEGCMVCSEFSKDAYDEIVDVLLHPDSSVASKNIRQVAHKFFRLDAGVEKYSSIYKDIVK